MSHPVTPSVWYLDSRRSILKVLVSKCYSLSCVQFFGDSVDYSLLAPLSMEFSRQEYWSGLPFPSLVDLPNTGNAPAFLESPALAGRFFTSWAPREVQGTKSWPKSITSVCDAGTEHLWTWIRVGLHLHRGHTESARPWSHSAPQALTLSEHLLLLQHPHEGQKTGQGCPGGHCVLGLAPQSQDAASPPLLGGLEEELHCVLV